MRRFGLIALAAVITGLVVGVVIADSGNSGTSTPSVPELKPPSGSIKSDSGTTDESTTTTDTTSTTTAPTQTQTQTTPSPTSGGAGAPQSDTEQNDQPPPQGSPADRFEQFCKDNPGAC
jgi:hypothetical protein